MVKILIVFLAAHILSFVVGCGIGRLCRVGSAEDLLDLQAEDASFNGAWMNTPLPTALNARCDSPDLDPAFPMSGLDSPGTFQT
jgi:hypothetical protein